MSLLPLAFVAMFTTWSSPVDSEQERTRVVRGVEVVWDVGQDTFPESWRGGEIAGKAEPAVKSDVDRALAAAKQALERYPTDLLARELKRIQILGRMTFYGVEYGGTNSLDTVYMTVRSSSEGFTSSYLIQTVHHELSSILLRNHPSKLDLVAWKAANPHGFTYGAGGTEAIRQGAADTRYDAGLAAQGFLAEYSKASHEEDFNMIAEGLFNGGAAFWSLVDAHPQLAAKARLAISFYSALDESFTEASFRSKSLEQ